MGNMSEGKIVCGFILSHIFIHFVFGGRMQNVEFAWDASLRSASRQLHA